MKILVLTAYFLWIFNYLQYGIGHKCYVIFGLSILFSGLIRKKLYFILSGCVLSLTGLLILKITQDPILDDIQKVAQQAGSV